MIRFSEARKRDVVSTGDAETIGRVDAFVVDPGGGRITALKLAKTSGDGDFVSWDDVTSFGRDVVTVAEPSVVRAASSEREKVVDKAGALVGKLVLSDAGRQLGNVEDVEFDPADGRVHALLTQSDEIPGERLRGVGSYAVVVRRH